MFFISLPQTNSRTQHINDPILDKLLSLKKEMNYHKIMVTLIQSDYSTLLNDLMLGTVVYRIEILAFDMHVFLIMNNYDKKINVLG